MASQQLCFVVLVATTIVTIVVISFVLQYKDVTIIKKVEEKSVVQSNLESPKEFDAATPSIGMSAGSSLAIPKEWTSKNITEAKDQCASIINEKPIPLPSNMSAGSSLAIPKEWTSKHITEAKDQCASIINEKPIPLPSNVGCQIPFMDPVHPSIMKFISNTADPQCSGKKYGELVDGMLKFTDPNVVSATYRPIKRNGEISYAMGSSVDVSPGAKIPDELLEVDFLLKDGKHVKEHFLHVVPHEHLVKQDAKKPPGIPLNILIMAIDSVSHASAKRKLPKIYEFLRDEMGAFFFNGLTVTGDGTVEQMAPMLTGMKFFEELSEARPDRGNSRTIDGWPWIYSHLKDRGYITGYSEDGTHFGPFNWRMKGFQKPPTDFYPLPFFRKAKSLLKGRDQCLGHKNINQYQYDYIRSLFSVFPRKLKFFISFAIGYSHHELNRVKKVQRDLLILLKELKTKGFLDNTLLVVMGDHGVRWGSVRETLQGKLEERMPLLSMSFPPSFRSRYPKLVANLRTNVDRLTTWYDVHATFRHMLSYPDSPVGLKHGQSLFSEVPVSRTCKDAHVADYWCPCLRWSAVDTKHSHAQKAALVAVEYMNALNSNHSKSAKHCAALVLKSVDHALLERPNERVLRFIHVDLSYTPRFRVSNNPTQTYFCRYQVRFATSPNDAVYVANVKYYRKKFVVSTDIARLNEKNEQSECVANDLPHLRKFCFCKTSVQKKNGR